MDCCKKDSFVLYQGYPSKWSDIDWLIINFDSSLDLTGYVAKFTLGEYSFEQNDLSVDWAINFTAEQTATLPIGMNSGTLVMYDTYGHGKPFSTSIPVLVKDWVDCDVDVQTYNVTVNANIQDSNKLVINMHSEAVDIAYIKEQIRIHNESHESHQYIQGLISDEETARKEADNVLQEAINEVSGSIGNGVLTIQKNGVDVQNFSANQKENAVANLSIPTKTSDIENDSDFVTNSGVETAISNHNESESAHSYIQGLISTEKTRAEGVEGNLSNLTTGDKDNLVEAINEVDSYAKTALQPSDVINAVDTTETEKPLSANMGKELQDQIDNLKARGRFLALWNCATGLAESNPPTGTYTYQSGDYFIVGVIAEAGGTNYKPDGSTYTTGVASTTVETAVVDVDDVYYYDGQVWRLQVNTQKTVSFVNIAGDPYDNSNLAAAFNQKQDTITGGASTITSNNLTANRALISNAQGKVAVSPVTNTELGYLSGVTSAIQTQLNGKASTSLDNLTSTGKNIGNWGTNLSNCITEIPQDIKLELSNGTLTLKSGSITTKTDGTQTQTTVDRTFTASGSSTYSGLVFCTAAGVIQGVKNFSQISSGSSLPDSGLNGDIFYNSTNNKIYFYGSSGWFEWDVALPIAVCTVTSGVITNIDQIFNGAGYIGSSTFILPGVKSLIPDGFNADGSLKSISNTVNSLIISNNPGGYTSFRYLVNNGDISPIFYYDEKTNYNNTSNGHWSRCCLATFDLTVSGGVKTISNFDIRQQVRLATTEMLDSVSDNVSTLDAQNVKLTGDQTIAGNKTFSGAVSLGSSATATTPASSDNDTSVATTAWGNTLVNGMRSNCVRYIPQDILLDLAADGTLTLKSGSVITMPDGSQLQTTLDNSVTISTNGVYFIFAVASSGAISTYAGEGVIKSGSSLPASGTFRDIFYNTSDNKIYRYTTQWTVWGVSFPIAKVTVSNDAISSIDQVFNGAGYIGHHAFLLPNISGLQANGFNPDGTLLSTIRTNSVLRIVEMVAGQAVTGYNRRLGMVAVGGVIQRYSFYQEYNTRSEAPLGTAFRYCYIKDENKILFCTTNNGTIYKSNDVMFIEYNYDGTNVTLFNVKQPVRMATTEMLDNFLKSISGYNPSSTQTLKNVNGVFTWVTDT